MNRILTLTGVIFKNSGFANIFTLNNTVAKLLKENEELQNICNHSFEDGYCILTPLNALERNENAIWSANNSNNI